MSTTDTTGKKTYFEDLRSIRKRRGLSDEDVSERTLITLDVIQAFEETGLLNHPRFNVVYLKALVQSYARAVHVDADLARRAYNDTIAGTYDGFLAVKYLEGGSIADISRSLETPGASGPRPKPTSRLSMPDPVDQPVPESPPITPSPRAEAAGLKLTPKPDKVEADPPGLTSSSSLRKPPKSEKKTSSGPRVLTLDEPEIKSKASSRQSARSNMSSSATSPALLMLTVASVIVILAIISWFTIDYLMQPTEPVVLTDDVVMMDDEVIPDTTVVPEPQAVVSLPDSMLLQIVAARGVLSPAYIRVDDVEYRRWVERGDTISFFMKERATLSGGPVTVGRIDVLVHGSPFSWAPSDTLSQVVITREDVIRSSGNSQ